ncbi:MAG: glucokinase [Chloroflexia bacterium]
MLLAGDIGGTKTELAIVSAEAGPRNPLAHGVFPSAQYPSLEAIVREFLDRTSYPVDRAWFDVAGPVIRQRAKITNLPWTIDAATLKDEFHLQSVRLLNDLEAIALAVPVLQPDDLHTVNAGQAVPGGALAVVAPGTGLGEGYLTWDGAAYEAHASEGGHTDFAPADELQTGLLQYVRKHVSGGDHVSTERVCCGSGIPTIYDYLRDSGYAPETPEIAARLAKVKDRTPIIVEAGMQLFLSQQGAVGARHASPVQQEATPDRKILPTSDRLMPAMSCSLCAATFDTFVAVLGAEAGNMALKVLATGGVYLGGGIPRRIIPALETDRFLHAFRRKGRLSDVLERVPIHVITRQAAIIGAARSGLMSTE